MKHYNISLNIKFNYNTALNKTKRQLKNVNF